MAIARVVTFEDIDAGHMADLQGRLDQGERPEGMPPVEVLVLHDTAAGKVHVVQIFDNDDDYRQGEAVFSAMPASDTPGRRTSVSRCEVAARMAG